MNLTDDSVPRYPPHVTRAGAKRLPRNFPVPVGSARTGTVRRLRLNRAEHRLKRAARETESDTTRERKPKERLGHFRLR